MICTEAHIPAFRHAAGAQDDMEGSRDTAVGIKMLIQLPSHDQHSYISYKRLLVSRGMGRGGGPAGGEIDEEIEGGTEGVRPTAVPRSHFPHN